MQTNCESAREMEAPLLATLRPAFHPQLHCQRSPCGFHCPHCFFLMIRNFPLPFSMSCWLQRAGNPRGQGRVEGQVLISWFPADGVPLGCDSWVPLSATPTKSGRPPRRTLPGPAGGSSCSSDICHRLCLTLGKLGGLRAGSENLMQIKGEFKEANCRLLPKAPPQFRKLLWHE